jgi:uncharacterized membrane protein YfcA
MTNTANGSLRARRELTLAGAGLILVAGLIHLFWTPEHFEKAAYLGVLLLADFAGSLVAAYGIYRGRRWGWALGALVAGGALVAYLLSCTLGLPGVEEGHLLEPWGVLAKTVEALFLVVCGFELTGFGRRALVGGLATVLVEAALAGAALILGGGEPTHHEVVAPSQQHDSKKHDSKQHAE